MDLVCGFLSPNEDTTDGTFIFHALQGNIPLLKHMLKVFFVDPHIVRVAIFEVKYKKRDVARSVEYRSDLAGITTLWGDFSDVGTFHVTTKEKNMMQLNETLQFLTNIIQHMPAHDNVVEGYWY